MKKEIKTAHDANIEYGDRFNVDWHYDSGGNVIKGAAAEFTETQINEWKEKAEKWDKLDEK